jgi:hypothetical protein
MLVICSFNICHWFNSRGIKSNGVNSLILCVVAKSLLTSDWHPVYIHCVDESWGRDPPEPISRTLHRYSKIHISVTVGGQFPGMPSLIPNLLILKHLILFSSCRECIIDKALSWDGLYTNSFTRKVCWEISPIICWDLFQVLCKFDMLMCSRLHSLQQAMRLF